MKLFQYLTIAVIGILAACQPQENKTTESKKVSSTKQTCYTYTKNRDTATLMLITSGRVVTGELIYKLFEKDSNNGIIKGEMRGDTLVADYTFNAEGKQSTRQVAFLKRDGKLAEGYGEISEKDGKIIFNNISTLKFGDAIEFIEVNCK
jgi:hypothetical protein